jgi:hypothetical protein
MFAGILGAAIHFVRFGRKAHAADEDDDSASPTPQAPSPKPGSQA